MAKIDLLLNQPQRQVFTENDLDIFGGGQPQQQLKESIVQLPIRSLVDWTDSDGKPQRWKPYSEEKLQQLAISIRQNGVLNPIIVRPYGAGIFQIIAGRNRKNASRIAGLDTIPAIIREADDDTATIILNTTNIDQREEQLPSEKAWAYRSMLEAISHQGKRQIPNCGLNDCKLAGNKSRDILAEQFGESSKQIQRYISLTYLIPDLFEMVDNNMLPMISGVSLSYLSEEQQRTVCEVSADLDKRISTAQAEQLRKLPEDSFTIEDVRNILLPKKAWNAINELSSRCRRLIPKTATPEDIEDVITLVENYFNGKGKGEKTNG